MLPVLTVHVILFHPRDVVAIPKDLAFHCTFSRVNNKPIQPIFARLPSSEKSCIQNLSFSRIKSQIQRTHAS